MIIRKFKESDVEEVSDLICNTFNEFIAKSFRVRGAKNFLKHETPEKVSERGKTRSMLVAVSGKKIVGVVESDGARVRRLFVDKLYQRKGLGTKLFKSVESRILKKKPRRIKIYSNVHAVGFYENMGYKKFGSVRENKEGIVYQLLVRRF